MTFYCRPSNLRAEHCSLAVQAISGQAGAMYFTACSRVLLSNVTARNNLAQSGAGGVHLASVENFTIIDCLLEGNTVRLIIISPD